MQNGYQIHSTKTAPVDAQPALAQIQQNLNFIPNALAAMAESPVTLSSYLQQGEMLQQTSFTDTERHLLYLTVTQEFDSVYCVSAHTAFAKMDGIPDDLIQQLRDGQTLADSRLETLRQFAKKMAQTNCNVSEQDVQMFLAQGYSRSQILELILLMTNKLLGAYCIRIMGVDLDEVLQPVKWHSAA